mgnify:CR=1 FL=1
MSNWIEIPYESKVESFSWSDRNSLMVRFKSDAFRSLDSIYSETSAAEYRQISKSVFNDLKKEMDTQDPVIRSESLLFTNLENPKNIKERIQKNTDTESISMVARDSRK